MDKWVVTQYLSDLNAITKWSLRYNQHIKFVCFDVSWNYIVFGANSGDLYMFNRKPCEFMKIIQCKGSVTQISISPNEEYLAVGSSKGMITLVQHCFTNNNVKQQVFTEFSRHSITALKWHLNKLYFGDAIGKISKVTVPNALGETTFHPSCILLLKLDSGIVQIDCYSVYLLISTHTRTFICNMEKKLCKQIGKKLRNKPLGACIFASSSVETESAGTSKTETQICEKIKLYCGQPNALLWEATTDGTVTNTYFVKYILTKSKISLMKLNEEPDSHLFISDKAIEFKNFSFTKVYKLENFIITFNSEGFYIFNPENGTIIACCNCFNRIKDIKIVEDLIYIFNENGEVNVVGVYNVKTIVQKTLLDKMFVVCGELCKNYLDDLLPLVKMPSKLHSLIVLKERLNETSDDLLQDLIPLFKALENCSNRNISIEHPSPKQVSSLKASENCSSRTISVEQPASEHVVLLLKASENCSRKQVSIEQPSLELVPSCKSLEKSFDRKVSIEQSTSELLPPLKKLENYSSSDISIEQSTSELAPLFKESENCLNVQVSIEQSTSELVPPFKELEKCSSTDIFIKQPTPEVVPLPKELESYFSREVSIEQSTSELGLPSKALKKCSSADNFIKQSTPEVVLHLKELESDYSTEVSIKQSTSELVPSFKVLEKCSTEKVLNEQPSSKLEPPLQALEECSSKKASTEPTTSAILAFLTGTKRTQKTVKSNKSFEREDYLSRVEYTSIDQLFPSSFGLPLYF